MPNQCTKSPRRIQLICPTCGKSFTIPLNASGRGKILHCSRPCAYADRQHISLADRFWPKVQQTDNCWFWTGAHLPRGYGILANPHHGTKNLLAHRASWELHFGLIPPGMEVCHICDNPSCVNPKHLFLGTHMSNVQDMHRKGRYGFPRALGKRSAQAKMTDEDVLAIRKRYASGTVSQPILAKEYGVAHTMIGKIVRGENWRHVGGPITLRAQTRDAE